MTRNAWKVMQTAGATLALCVVVVAPAAAVSVYSFKVPLTVSRGGTGATTLTAHGVVLGEGTSAVAVTAAGTAGQCLVSGGASADPAFATLGVAGGGSGVATCTAYSPIVAGTTATGAWRCTDGPGTAGYAWTSNGAGVTPSWQAVSAGANTALSNLASVAANIPLLGTAGTAAAPAYSVTGDTDNGLYFPATNTSAVASGGKDAARFEAATNAVNYLDVTPSATTVNVTVATAGSDSTIGMTLTPKGNGNLLFNSTGTLQIGATDTGMTRNGAGTIQATDGGAGDGAYGASLLAAINRAGSYKSKLTATEGLIIASAGNIIASSSSALGGITSGDTNMSRIAAGVWGFSAGTQGTHAGYIQYGGTCVVASDQANASTTPQTSACYNTTSGTVAIALAAGRSYTGLCELFLSDSTAVDGAVVDFDASTATATTFRAQVTAFDTALNLSTQTTALATDAAATTFTNAGAFEVHLFFKVNAAGSFQPRFFQASHSAGTLTLAAGSYCTLTDATP